ncbi:MAG: integrase family protein [Verrucomicrobiales bacterium]|nr:integrase family protein [Verrucomicrobiales bacterium]
MFDRKGHRKYLNKAERRAFFMVAKKEPNRLRRAFCLTLYYTGCRISEALNLTVSQLDFAEKALVFETLKQPEQGHFRSMPIPEGLVKLLAALTKDASPSARIWDFSRVTAWRLVKEKMRLAGISGTQACPKGLRHGFGVACIGKAVPLTTVKKWLGHKRLETTAIYLDVAGEEERELAKRIWYGG